MKESDMIGDFTVKSGELLISDPCYEDDGSCNYVSKKAKKGTWAVQIKR